MAELTVDLGAVRPNYKGAWDENTNYNHMDIVSNRNCLWICLVDNYAEGDEPIHWYDDETYEGEEAPEDPNITRSGSWLCIAEKGDKGDKGDQGIQGVAGRDGTDGEQGPRGTAPAHEWNGTQLRWQNPDGTWADWADLIGPQGNEGPQGVQGIQGPTGVTGATGPAGKGATITIGTVTTVGPNEIARVENVGDSNDAVLNFSIPQGKTGATGAMPTDYVSLNGSVVNGTYSFAFGDRLNVTDSNHWLRICGGTAYTEGANLLLYGKGCANGNFLLEARSPSASSGLSGEANGSLTWSGPRITCNSFNGTATRAVSDSLGNNIYNTYFRQGDNVKSALMVSDQQNIHFRPSGFTDGGFYLSGSTGTNNVWHRILTTADTNGNSVLLGDVQVFGETHSYTLPSGTWVVFCMVYSSDCHYAGFLPQYSGLKAGGTTLVNERDYIGGIAIRVS